MSFWRSIKRLFVPSGREERVQAMQVTEQAANRAAEQQAANTALLAQQQEAARQQAEAQRALMQKIADDQRMDQQADIARTQQAELDKTRLDQARIAQEGEAAASAMVQRVKRASSARGVASTLLRRTGLQAGPTASATLLGA